MLLEMNRPQEALQQFETGLQREPNRFRLLYGAAKAAQRSGNYESSRRYFSELLTVCQRADKPGRNELAEALATRQ
jgi:tetratricopeptide (TPR) repeat protein